MLYALILYSYISEERPFICEICGMSFAMSYYLRRHQNRHFGVPPDPRYTCQICQKVLSSNSALRIHALTHVRKYKFYCSSFECYVIVRVYLSVFSQLRGLRVRAQRDPVAS